MQDPGAVAQRAFPAGADRGQARHLGLRVVGLQIQVHAVLVATLCRPMQQQPQATGRLTEGHVPVVARVAGDHRSVQRGRPEGHRLLQVGGVDDHRRHPDPVSPGAQIVAHGAQVTSASRSSRCAGR
jgi:hypothetical protein